MTRLFTVLIVLFTAFSAQAAQVAHLYQAEVAIDSQSESDRNRVLPDALKQVIVKLVGDRQQVNQADITAILADAQRYVGQFAYQQVNADNMDLTSPQELAVVIDFDKPTLDRALEQVGLPRWGANRPQILFWIASEQAGQHQLIADETDAVTVTLKSLAKQRGLPVLMPVMDLEDQSQISFSDIWTGNVAALNRASNRYGAKLVVSLQIRGNNDQTGISWQLLSGDETQRWSSEGPLSDALAQGMHELADRLGRRFAIQTGEATAYKLQISNVQNYADYQRLSQYFRQSQTVASFSVQSLAEGVLDAELQLRGDVNRFRELLAFDNVLVPEQSSATNQTERYRLMP
ncbi:hypothetical protein Q7C_2636 [Methylophaga frappieri]|uniref:DUF2066 domain-containing protein n=1 Tax=Methylophaga frappieri (strain ATCC BAA-2434 / DSM 25690 / JAM7) TaxID=754477 RepID=I1YLG4_METFJ|nr:DUF2066 domain-containing protein [Methylophaga frappieri]AFJ03757.1 hypothetical protein Q7C_2636 [Methylophaga frappieri]